MRDTLIERLRRITGPEILVKVAGVLFPLQDVLIKQIRQTVDDDMLVNVLAVLFPKRTPSPPPPVSPPTPKVKRHRAKQPAAESGNVIVQLPVH